MSYKCLFFQPAFSFNYISTRICMSINIHYLIVAYSFNGCSVILTSVLCSSEQTGNKLNRVLSLCEFFMHINWCLYFPGETHSMMCSDYFHLCPPGLTESGRGRPRYTHMNPGFLGSREKTECFQNPPLKGTSFPGGC